MLRTLPGLSAIKAFDAAARHLSFTKAAQELSVTPAAVSHQIKELEDQIGVSLFLRTSRSMRLTREGEILRTSVSDALDGLNGALQRIRKLQKQNRLNVTASPSITAKWLVPRLDRFLASVPGADVRIDVSQSVLDFDRDDVDIAIRFGTGRLSWAYASIACSRKWCSRCAARSFSPAATRSASRAICSITISSISTIRPRARSGPIGACGCWPPAFANSTTRAAFISARPLSSCRRRSRARAWHWANRRWFRPILQSGRLVKPFELALKAPPQFAYYLISPLETADTPIVKAFREWILAEASAMPPQPSG